jgi:hypothetical protein
MLDLVGFYLLALAMGLGVAFAVFADLTRRGHPDARKRALSAVGFAACGLFIVPLLRHLYARE